MIEAVFLTSSNGNDRAQGASALGYIGARDAVPRLVALLNDTDWRVVFAAARSLGWLGAHEAAPALARIADAHWLDSVRDEAKAVLASLAPGARPVARPSPFANFLQDRRVVLDVDANDAPHIAPFKSGQWRYGGIAFAEPTTRQLLVSDGALGAGGHVTVRDDGEWGGGLWWSSPGHPPGSPLIAMNGNSVAPSSQGAVALVGEQGNFTLYDPATSGGRQEGGNGPDGYGFVVALTVRDGVLVSTKEIARLPRGGDVIASIGPDLYAAWSGGRVVMFDLGGIRGTAACVAP